MFKFRAEGTCKNRGDVLVLLMFLEFTLADALWAKDAARDGCSLEIDGEEGRASFVPQDDGSVSFSLQANEEANIRRFEAGLDALCYTRIFVHWRRRS